MHIAISFIIHYFLIQGASIVPFDYTNATMCVQHVVHITLHPLSSYNLFDTTHQRYLMYSHIYIMLVQSKSICSQGI